MRWSLQYVKGGRRGEIEIGNWLELKKLYKWERRTSECAKSHSRIDYDFDERQYYFSFPFLLYFNSNRKHLSNLSLNFSLISLLGWVLYYSHTTLFCIFANINDVHYLYPNTSNGWTISSKTSYCSTIIMIWNYYCSNVWDRMKICIFMA